MKTASASDTPAPLPVSAQDLLGVLQTLDIEVKLYEHEPIFTVAEGEHLKADMPGVHVRNLFLRDKKKKNFLIVAANETEIDLKKLSDLIGAARFSFGSDERLFEHLGIRPGAVNPFTVINDPDNQVTLYLDATMMDADLINVHPMDNAKTVGIAPKDLIRFLDHIGHDYSIIDLSPARP